MLLWEEFTCVKQTPTARILVDYINVDLWAKNLPMTFNSRG